MKLGMVSPVVRQFITVACCNLASFSYGTLFGWTTINFIDLQDDSSCFPAGKFTLEEATLAVSIVNVGGLIGNFALLPIASHVGTKRAIHFLGFPLILSSLLILWAQNKYFLYLSRVLSGFVGGAMIVSLPILIADISFDNVRGSLNSIYDPSYNLGMLFSFLLGEYFNCMDQVKIQLLVPILFVLMLFLFPESPEYHTKRNNTEQVMKSMKFFKCEHSVKRSEMKSMKQGISDDDGKLTFSDFMTPQAKRAIFIIFILYLITIGCGTLVILSFAPAIFAHTGSSMNEKVASILVSFVQLSTNIVFMNIVDRFDRTKLFIWSSIFTAAAYFLFGIHALLWTKNPNLQWMTPLCFSLIIFLGGFGIVPMSYIILMEIFPKKIRKPCIATAVSMYWINLFLLELAYPLAEAALGLSTCMFSFGIICILGALFCYGYVPETRGKSYEQIMELLSNQN